MQKNFINDGMWIFSLLWFFYIGTQNIKLRKFNYVVNINIDSFNIFQPIFKKKKKNRNSFFQIVGLDGAYVHFFQFVFTQVIAKNEVKKTALAALNHDFTQHPPKAKRRKKNSKMKKVSLTLVQGFEWAMYTNDEHYLLVILDPHSLYRLFPYKLHTFCMERTKFLTTPHPQMPFVICA